MLARISTTHLAALVASLLTLGVASDAGAQSDDERRARFNSIAWTDGPGTGRLGKEAQLSVIEGCRFTEAKGARTFMEITQNPPGGDEVGLLFCETAPAGNPAAAETWFVVFEYDPSGYVKDDEKTTLDADAILATLREGQEMGNEERRRRGWAELSLDGWIRPPYYDEVTNNLTWAIAVRADADTTVNHSVRLLGRGGVLKADLVTGTGAFELALPAFNEVIAATSFVAGRTYAEWRDGDKVAAYGLTALVAGGAGAAAAKLGLFGKLWKLIVTAFVAAWKLIAIAVVAAGAWIRSLFAKKSSDTARTPARGG
jgi:uncharacterized membrane-anchored protein